MNTIDLLPSEYTSDDRMSEDEALAFWCSTPDRPSLKKRLGVRSELNIWLVFGMIVWAAIGIFSASLK